MRNYKIFNRKHYQRAEEYQTKRAAKHEADSYREEGYLARVIKEKVGTLKLWVVWARKAT